MVPRVDVLVLGGGGREHALAEALRRDPDVGDVHAAPGNPGIATVAEVHPLDPLDADAVIALATRLAVDLVVVGPEAPLVAGVADAVRARGLACFGPGRDAARIEGSKSFAKEVMAAAGIPTAQSRSCTTASQADDALEAFGPPYVVKDDGLAAGKGVLVTPDRDAARRHAEACRRVVIEEYLDGPEVSLFALCDGSRVLPMQPAQDAKRLLDGDTGPNTGGMGAYTPLPWAPPSLSDEVTERVLRPAVAELARRDTPFQGLLYAGLALTSRGVRVVEFNARFGDPETQALLPLLESPLGATLYAAATGRLADAPALVWRTGAAVTVVIAAAGYPETPRRGDAISGLDRAASHPGVHVSHAGTATDADGALVTAGGRVLAVTATGADLPAARTSAYRAVDEITFDGCQYRTDIAAAAAAAATDSAPASRG